MKTLFEELGRKMSLLHGIKNIVKLFVVVKMRAVGGVVVLPP
jgi:hypothetical protein